MKLVVTTIYETVDEAWLKWWLSECGPNYGMTEFVPGGRHTIKSKDPSSEVVGTTTIEVRTKTSV